MGSHIRESVKKNGIHIKLKSYKLEPLGKLAFNKDILPEYACFNQNQISKK